MSLSSGILQRGPPATSDAQASNSSTRSSPRNTPRAGWAAMSLNSAGANSGTMVPRNNSSGSTGEPFFRSILGSSGIGGGNAARQRGAGNSATTGPPSTHSSDDEEEVIDVEVIGEDPQFFGGAGVDERRQISWQCGACQYCVLAMDHRGKPLPISVDAWGQPIPMQCPRCLSTHTKWALASPFDAHGDHVNVKGCFANTIPRLFRGDGQSTRCRDTKQVVLADGSEATLGPPVAAAGSAGGPRSMEHLPPILASIGLVTYRNGVPQSTVKDAPPVRKQRLSYYCCLCNRRLLRMDHNGDLVVLDTNARGEFVPLTCPGCGVLHSDWAIRPS